MFLTFIFMKLKAAIVFNFYFIKIKAAIVFLFLFLTPFKAAISIFNQAQAHRYTADSMCLLT